MKVKENISLIVGLSIPLLMILFIGLSIYLPGLFVQPRYNFLYASGGDYSSIKKYDVKNEKLIEGDVKYPEKYEGVKKEPKLFMHDILKNESREISFEEAQKLILDDHTKSPDGFEIVSGGYGGDIFSLFYSHSNYGKQYIKGHNVSKELNIRMSNSSRDYYYYQNFEFIAWIKE